MPAVSVIIPCFNRRQFVGLAVESVLAQTFSDLEIIVVDDGSTDGTADQLAAQFGSRIQVERLPHNQGRSTARNTGWAIARGEFVAFLDSDDVWLPRKLARQMPRFERGEVVLVHCRVGEIDAQGQPLAAESTALEREFVRAEKRGYDYGGITETWCRMYTSAVVLRRELLPRIGGFDPRISNWEDWDLLWRAAREGEVATVQETLVLHRAHAGNTPTVWMEDAAPWLSVNRKHLAELEIHNWTALRNLRVNMALGEYWRRNLAASRKWMWRALWTDPSLLKNPGYSAWGAPLLHACLPHRVAASLVEKLGVDDYKTTGINEITLAIDDGPTEATEALLSRLEHAGHRAVLFILGCNVFGREEIVIQAIRRGFALGNHSFLHPYFSALSLEEASISIEKTERLIETLYAEAGVERPGKWFRFPYLDAGGERSIEFQRMLRELGFERPPATGTWLKDHEQTRLDWPTTLRPEDYELPPESLLRSKLRRARPGEVLEFHDNPETIARYAHILVEELSRLSLRGTIPAGRAVPA